MGYKVCIGMDAGKATDLLSYRDTVVYQALEMKSLSKTTKGSYTQQRKRKISQNRA